MSFYISDALTIDTTMIVSLERVVRNDETGLFFTDRRYTESHESWFCRIILTNGATLLASTEHYSKLKKLLIL